MIWDYQRPALFNVIWHGNLRFEPGELVKFIGKLSDPVTMQASVAIERDGTVHEQPEHARLDEEYPLEGKVFSSEVRGDKSYISVYQTVPNLFSFPNLSHHRAFLMLPELWNFLEERSEWNELLPGLKQLRDLKEERYKHPDIADTAWAVHRYGNLSGILPGDQVRRINGHIMSKIEQLFRLKRRAEFGNRLKLHLLTLAPHEGRTFLLDELVHEGPMTLEHAAYAAYAVLDLTAHLVSITLQLGIAELQTSFTAVLGKDSAEPTEHNLRNRFPALPLTQFWLGQQSVWIANLRDMRHEFAHRGAAAPVYGPNERLLAMSFDVPSSEVSPIFDVQDVVADWFSRSERFFTESLRMLADYCLNAVERFEADPVRPPVEPPRPNSELDKTLRDTLRLLFGANEGNPKREEHLYARLEGTWRKRWPLAKFKKFISTVEGVSLDNRHVVGFSSGPDGSSATVKVILVIRGKSLPWILQFQKEEGARAFLVRTAMTIPVGEEPQTAIAEFSAKQSGRETGHSCAEFCFTLTNVGSKPLKSVVVVVSHSDLEAARAEIGDLDPGQSVPVFATTTQELGRVLPLGGPYMFVTLISEAVTVRVVYDLETDLGDEWADEHRCSNPSRTK